MTAWRWSATGSVTAPVGPESEVVLINVRHLWLIWLPLVVALSVSANSPIEEELVVYDESRNRHIPILVNAPQTTSCAHTSPCPVALLSAGYGVSHTRYRFITNTLNQLGYLVVSIGHELKGDPPLGKGANLFHARSPNWQRGAATLDFLQRTLLPRYPSYDFQRILLVGHSNGGDISTWLTNEDKAYIAGLITLDHRRVPLPRQTGVAILSLRASDFPADPGVLPSTGEHEPNICVLKIPQSRHNDMSDYGPDWLKQRISLQIDHFIRQRKCVLVEK